MAKPIRCPRCGRENDAGFAFCLDCGQALGAKMPPAGEQPARGPGRIRLAAVRSDGAPGPVFTVEKDEAICGRTDGDIRLADDPTVSPRHARFTLAGGVLRVEDLGSVNGTFLQLEGPRRVSVGEELRLGRQLLRLEPLPQPAHAEEIGR